MSDLQAQLNELAKRMGEQMATFIKSLQDRISEQDKEIKSLRETLTKSILGTSEEINSRFNQINEATEEWRSEQSGVLSKALEGYASETEKLIDEFGISIKDNSDAIEEVKAMVKGINQPSDGKDGKDALDIEILPIIDEDKSYARGTFATHNGGLFRAFQKTVGMVGWECIVNGISKIDASIDGDNLKLVIATSDGSIENLLKPLPYPKYKGVFNRDQQGYSVGDSVTWDGSLWIACTDDPVGDPNKSADWRLAVKRGKDGKGLYAIARENGFKGTEKDLINHIVKGEQPETIVRL